MTQLTAGADADANAPSTSQLKVTESKGPRFEEEIEEEEAERDESIDITQTPKAPTYNRTKAKPTSKFNRRLLFIATFLLVAWLAYSIHKHRVRKQQRSNIIYASRYSKEHKYRPAASPIITETLKDGRIRLRGATPPPPTPTPTPTSTRRRRAARKRKAAAAKKKSTKPKRT